MSRIPRILRPVQVDRTSCEGLATVIRTLFPHTELSRISNGVESLVVYLLRQGVSIDGRDIGVEKIAPGRAILTWESDERILVRVDFTVQRSVIRVGRVSFPQEEIDPDVARILAKVRRNRLRIHRLLGN